MVKQKFLSLFHLKVKCLLYICSGLKRSDKILILGNGGVKNTKTYEESKELSGYVLTLQNFDRLIKEGVKDGTISVTENKIETDKTFDV